jgi:hypothetical protein
LEVYRVGASLGIEMGESPEGCGKERWVARAREGEGSEEAVRSSAGRGREMDWRRSKRGSELEDAEEDMVMSDSASDSGS